MNSSWLLSRGKPSTGHRTQVKSARLRTLVVGAIATLAIPAAIITAPTASAATCINQVTGSNFEIDPDANLTIESSGCIDWLNGSTLRGSNQQDEPTGAGDDAFGQGTAENDTNPTIVERFDPAEQERPEVFGVNTETTAGKYLQLFWSRVQNPSGTTNMDFELNKKFCDRRDADELREQRQERQSTRHRCARRRQADHLRPVQGRDRPDDLDPHLGRFRLGDRDDHQRAASTGASARSTRPPSRGRSGGLGAPDPYTFGEASIDLHGTLPGRHCVRHVRLGVPEEPFVGLVHRRAEGLHLTGAREHQQLLRLRPARPSVVIARPS